jgi:hypothetical protein
MSRGIQLMIRLKSKNQHPIVNSACCKLATFRRRPAGADGRDRVVRHGHGPQRAIQTGIGPVEVRRAKVRDRGGVSAREKIRFTSSILPKWVRRTKSLDAIFRRGSPPSWARTRQTCRKPPSEGWRTGRTRRVGDPDHREPAGVLYGNGDVRSQSKAAALTRVISLLKDRNRDGIGH